MPISFSDAALSRFASEANQNRGITRAELQSDATLYQRYIEWWDGKRKGFLIAMRDYLRQSGNVDPTVLFTGCSAEPGVGFADWQPYIVTDQAQLWTEIVQEPEHQVKDRPLIKPMSVGDVIARSLYRDALKSPGLNWGGWEIQHAQPADDPQNYHDLEGVMLTHAFNRNYTVQDPRSLDDYSTRSGLAMIRHYALNEHMLFDAAEKEKLGYSVCDVEHAGPYCMMAEALAMANGNPTMIGYLTGTNFGRGFPQYVREFNANFLALPALPSIIVPDAASDHAVIVRRIDTEKDGSWLAIVNTSMEPKTSQINCDGTEVKHAVNGKPQAITNGQFELTLYPFQLKSFHIDR